MAPVAGSSALAALEEVPVDRVGGEERGRERDHHADPEDHIHQSGLHGAGDDRHDEVVDDLHRGDRERVGGEHDAQHGKEPQAGLHQRDGGEQVAEEERETDREDDGPPGRQPDHRADDQPRDLTDRTAGQAVKGGAGGHRVQASTTMPCLVRVVVMRVRALGVLAVTGTAFWVRHGSTSSSVMDGPDAARLEANMYPMGVYGIEEGQSRFTAMGSPDSHQGPASAAA